MTSIRGDVGVGVGVRSFVGGVGGGVGDDFPVHGVSVFAAKWPRLLTLPAERYETSTFSVQQRHHLPVLLPTHTTTTTQNPP